MRIDEVRLRNLERLMRDRRWKHAKDFCDFVGISPTYISQVRNKTKKLGDALAERIEDALGLPQGEMDSQVAILEENRGHGVAAIAHAIQTLPPSVRAHLAGLVFALAQSSMTSAQAPTFNKQVPDDEAGDGNESSPIPTARRN